MTREEHLGKILRWMFQEFSHPLTPEGKDFFLLTLWGLLDRAIEDGIQEKLREGK